ncbi:MAG TPA: MFS transporter [Candidatus Dormibacteraeota bacterium]|nr:MFS transporter [Candidatus Dormibacteraeota bacterium]
MGLLRDREFLKFWSGQSMSLIGSQFTLLALPIAAGVGLHATAAEMGVLAALQFAPGLLFGLPAGVWLDRVRRRPVLIGSQLASAAVLAWVPLAAALHVLTIQQLYAVAFLSGTAAAFFGVAQFAFVPALVGRDRLLEANACAQTSQTAASLIGPGLAGAAVQLLTAPIAVAVDAASFLVGAATAASVRVAEPAPPRAMGRSALREAIEGLALVWRLPLVRAITGTLVIANAGGGMAAPVLVLLFVGRIGLSPAQFGLVFVASSASSLAGSVLIRPLQHRAGVGPAMVFATALVGAGAIVRAGAAFTHQPMTFPLLVAGALVGGFGLMTYNVPQRAIQQAVVPDRLLGRATAAVSLAIYAASAGASLAGGLLGQLAGLRATLVVAAAIMVLCALPTALGPLRALRELRPSPRPSSAA